jgi:release factor glutamine methyltransferase
VTLERGATAGALLKGATGTLAAAGCDTPRLDAELLLASVLAVPRPRLVLEARGALRPAEGQLFEQLVARRAAREPVAYILGRRAFRRIELAVDSRVLIPRPETEQLVEAALSLPLGVRVVDVGTGSGAVALALKEERPDLHVWGSDVSADALAVARGNAARLGLEVNFVRANLLDGLAGFDAVVANLPYVAAGTELQPEIALYEPGPALFAGEDGLDAIRGLIDQLDGVPFVALEVGFDQAAAVSALLAAAGFAALKCRRDLAGHERVVVGQR